MTALTGERNLISSIMPTQKVHAPHAKLPQQKLHGRGGRSFSSHLHTSRTNFNPAKFATGNTNSTTPIGASPSPGLPGEAA
jgi:hypothetical protein